MGGEEGQRGRWTDREVLMGIEGWNEEGWSDRGMVEGWGE